MAHTTSLDEIARDCLAFRVRLISRSVTALYEQAVSSHGITVAQLNMLVALGKIRKCAPGQLGDLLQLERSTVSRNLSHLLAQGWVEAVSTDAKGIREITLTPAGLNKVDSVLPDWRSAQREATRIIGEQNVRALHEVAANFGPSIP